MQHDLAAGFGQLPSGLRAGEAGADHVYGRDGWNIRHECTIQPWRTDGNRLQCIRGNSQDTAAVQRLKAFAAEVDPWG